jgi:hypothetical protein
VDRNGRDALRRILGVDELGEAQDCKLGGLVGGLSRDDQVGGDTEETEMLVAAS